VLISLQIVVRSWVNEQVNSVSAQWETCNAGGRLAEGQLEGCELLHPHSHSQLSCGAN
jgi:hypothetical protein